MTHSATIAAHSPSFSARIERISTLRLMLARWCPGIRMFGCNALRIAGMVPVLLVLIIHILVYVAGVWGTLLPLYSTHPAASTALLVIFHFIFVMTLINYSVLVIADPGSPPADWKAPPPSTFFHQPPNPFLTRFSTQSPINSNPPQHHTPINQTHSLPPPDRLVSTSTEPVPLIQIPPAASSPPSSPFLSPSSIVAHTSVTVDPQPSAHHVQFRYAHLMHERTFEGYLRYCQTCNSYKPDRSHHCSVCRRCILKMDHHCVFVNNCISFYNYKFFICFITYAFIGCLFVTIVTFPTFADIISLKTSHIMSLSNIAQSSAVSRFVHGTHTPWRVTSSVFAKFVADPFVLHSLLANLSSAPRLSPFVRTIVLIGYISASAFSFALAIFIALHYYLVSKGRTTIEMYEMTDPVRAPRVAQYDLGLRRNFKSVCGSLPLCWPLPVRAYIDGDGITYQRKVPPHIYTSAV